MATKITKTQILSLYKMLMRESEKFTNYNFRSYAVRRIKDSFQENKSITDPKAIKKQYEFAVENLNCIRRQIIVGDMYRAEKLVIENSR